MCRLPQFISPGCAGQRSGHWTSTWGPQHVGDGRAKEALVKVNSWTTWFFGNTRCNLMSLTLVICHFPFFISLLHSLMIWVELIFLLLLLYPPGISVSWSLQCFICSLPPGRFDKIIQNHEGLTASHALCTRSAPASPPHSTILPRSFDVCLLCFFSPFILHSDSLNSLIFVIVLLKILRHFMFISFMFLLFSQLCFPGHSFISNDCAFQISTFHQVVRVAESNGLKLPREFALLVKQAG